MIFDMIVVKPKHKEKEKLTYIDRHNRDSIHKNRRHLRRHIKARFDTSNYELDRPLSSWKYKKVIPLMKDKLGGK